MAHLEFFPREVQELQKEALKHPVLMAQLAKREDTSTIGGLKVVATYCDVLLDGYYSQPDLVALSGVLVDRLREKRKSLVFLENLK